MDNKKLYKQLCNDNLEIPLFKKDWWLNAVCGSSNWNVVLYIENNKIFGVLPFYLKKKFYFKSIINPPFTNSMGPWIDSSIKNHQKIYKITNHLINELPKFNYIDINLDYKSDDWLPFYWNGYNQTNVFTVIIEQVNNKNNLLSKFQRTNRRVVRRAIKNNLKFSEDVSVDEFYKNHIFFLKKNNRKINYSIKTFKNLFEECKKYNCGSLYAVKDKEHKILSMAFVVWDHEKSFLLLNSTDSEYRNTGCTQFLLFNILNNLKENIKTFDFRGSMDKNIFDFYNSFGGKVFAYNKVVKYSSLFFKFTIPLYINFRNKQHNINHNTINFIEI